MIKYKIIGSVASVALMVNFFVNLKFNSPEETVEEESSEKIFNERPKTKSQANRNPASRASTQPNKEMYKPEVSRSELDNSNFEGASSSSQSNQGPIVSGGYGNNKSFPSAPSLIRESAQERSFELPKVALTEKNKSGEEVPLRPSALPDPDPDVAIFKPSTKPDINPDFPVGGSNFPNTCSSNITGGSFNNPIGINLSCSSISVIKYCLELDTGAGCCDPHAAGVTYNSQVIVGAQNGNYCLSYYGESDSAGTSLDSQHSYTINSTLPDLQVAHPQINYQTTQLAGKSIINSSDFGKAGFYIGQINLKTHDPGPAALNLDCEEIITNYVSLPAPAPLSILSLLDVSLDNPAVQIEIPLRVDQLEYGDNFITSYISDNNFAAPIYACSTSKVVLFDFEFFQEELAFGDVGDNSVREFTGGFSSFGFFEDQATVYRGPAGVNSEDNSGQKLQYGMFGIFY